MTAAAAHLAWGPIQPSHSSANTKNPIRGIVDSIKPDPQHPLKMLALSIGDPTLDGNFLPPPNAVDAFDKIIRGAKHNGYLMSHGSVEGRTAVAKYWGRFMTTVTADGATKLPEDLSHSSKFPLPTADDVILSSGCSQALEFAITTLCNPGDILLIPKPGFSIYGVIAANRGIRVEYYNCVASKSWEIDLEALGAQVAALGGPAAVKGIVVTNPSNPCGSNFSREHVTNIVRLCEEWKVPIVADEIYAGMSFDAETNPFTSVSDVVLPHGDHFHHAPRIIVGGTAKNFMVPGWRMGWCIRVDPMRRLDAIWQGMIAVSQICVGPCALLQGILPQMLLETPASYTLQVNQTLKQHSEICLTAFQGVSHNLEAVKPQGAMYMLVRLKMTEGPNAHMIGREDIHNDVEFCQKLIKEKNVVVLPGVIFGAPNFFRIVFTKPPEQLTEAVQRIADFCAAK